MDDGACLCKVVATIRADIFPGSDRSSTFTLTLYSLALAPFSSLTPKPFSALAFAHALEAFDVVVINVTDSKQKRSK